MAGIPPIERAILVVRNFGIDPPAERWLAVTATVPDDDTLGIEIGSPGYERPLVTFAPSTHGETHSTNLVTFSTSDRSLDDAAGIEVWTAKTGGSRVYYSALVVASVTGSYDDGEDTTLETKPGAISYELPPGTTIRLGIEALA